MKVVILAGGKGTRLMEETTMRPKPMVEIGSKPILWHIMKIYAAQGYKDFMIACGYKGEMIKEYFNNYYIHNCDFFLNLHEGTRQIISTNGMDWCIGMIDTGLETMTGGRLKRLREFIGKEPFMVTYGDGLGNINLEALVATHQTAGRIATVTAVRPPARFGSLVLQGASVAEFSEKPQTGEGWINGGFFIFEPEVFDYIGGDESILERETLEQLARAGELAAYRHDGFWQPMDTLRDKQLLETLWANGNPPWKIWD